MTGRELLDHAGNTSHEAALQKAHAAYEKYRMKMLEEPTDVEKQFIAVEEELKRIEPAKKRKGKHDKA